MVVHVKLQKVIFFNKQKQQKDENFLEQSKVFSNRLPYANEETRKIFVAMVNVSFKTTEDMIIEVQQLKGKTKSKFYQIISNYYDKMIYRG